MEKKINIAELLKNCPSGMELDCVMYNKVTLLNVDREDIVFPIRVKREDGNPVTFTKYGQYTNADFAKCVIFPKGKTTWEGFVPPCKFKAGDVLYVDCADEESDGDLYKYIFILKEIDNLGNHFSYCHLYRDKLSPRSHYLFDNRYTPRLATEEEKEKLFNAIKDNGYKWNPETKVLEKLIEPKFKVGDKVRHKTTNKDDVYEISKVYDDSYELVDFTWVLYMKHQDNWELVPGKFDITTLKPFDRVLVRLTNNCVWMPKFFSYYDTDPKIKYYPFVTIDNISYPQCIPYNGNEHLCRKTYDCNEYFKTWE